MLHHPYIRLWKSCSSSRRDTKNYTKFARLLISFQGHGSQGIFIIKIVIPACKFVEKLTNAGVPFKFNEIFPNIIL